MSFPEIPLEPSNKHFSWPAECFDCRRPTDSYMVHNRVWLTAWPSYGADRRRGLDALVERLGDLTQARREYRGAHLCFNCLERRLGRPLSPKDFDPDLPINRGILLGISLMAGERFSNVLREMREPTPDHVWRGLFDDAKNWGRTARDARSRGDLRKVALAHHRAASRLRAAQCRLGLYAYKSPK